MRVQARDRAVRLYLDDSESYFKLTPDAARKLADALVAKADEAVVSKKHYDGKNFLDAFADLFKQ